jgi:hypothetical protein
VVKTSTARALVRKIIKKRAGKKEKLPQLTAHLFKTGVVQ